MNEILSIFQFLSNKIFFWNVFNFFFSKTRYIYFTWGSQTYLFQITMNLKDNYFKRNICWLNICFLSCFLLFLQRYVTTLSIFIWDMIETNSNSLLTFFDIRTTKKKSVLNYRLFAVFYFLFFFYRICNWLSKNVFLFVFIKLCIILALHFFCFFYVKITFF